MYLFYFDESGSRDPNPAPNPLYVLLAVGIWEGHWRKLERGVTNVKLELIDRLRRNGQGAFDLSDCEVKSNWLRQPKERAQKSRFLHALDDTGRTKLADAFYAQLEPIRATIFAVVIDKRHLLAHMTHETMHKKAYEFVLERIQHFIKEYHPKHNAMIIMDDTGPELNRAVAMKHAHFQRAGNQNSMFDRIIEYPFFSPSELSTGVQLADLCAYNVYRAFSDEDFAYPYFERLLPYVYRRQNGSRLDGLKVWPEQSKLIDFSKNGWGKWAAARPGL